MKTPRRSGQVLILAPAMLIALCLAAVISVDVGHLCTSKARLQNGADAAALAAILELWEQRVHHDSSDENSCRNAANNEAGTIAVINASGSACQVEWGTWHGGVFTPLDASFSADAARVRAVRDPDAPGGPVRTFFSRLVGLGEVSEDARAVATFRPRGMMPFAVDEDSLVPPGQSLVLYDDTETAPGNCGLLDYDGGENSADDIKNWSKDGYWGDIYIDPTVGYLLIAGTTGLKSNVTSSLDYHITRGLPVTCCVYRHVTGTGSGAEYTIVGYVAVRIDDYQMNATGDDIVSVTTTLLGSYIVDSGSTEGMLTGFVELELVE
jgi:hypothetical protein